jgi:O-antigen biosynthesis protein
VKIVYILFSNLVCGGHIQALQHVNRLIDRGHEVSVCLLDESVEVSESFSWFPNFCAKVLHPQNFPENVDISVATYWATAIPSLNMPSKHKVYFVQLDETLFFDDPAVKSRVALTYLCNFTYITEARWVVDWLKNSFGHDAEYIPKGFDEKTVHPVEPIQPKKEGKFRILIEGSIAAPFKRVREALEVCKDFDCEVWCISNYGEFPPDIKIDRVFSQVNFNDMKYIYSSCDILLKLSSVEGVFGPPLEMMACGGVCIVSDVKGHDEYIHHEHNALVVPGGDVDLAKQALKRLMFDKELFKHLQHNGALTARSMKWDASIDKLENLFARLVSLSPGLYSDYKYTSLVDNSLMHTQMANSQLEILQANVEGMQRSNFWKLRNVWFKFKNAIGQLLGRGKKI